MRKAIVTLGRMNPVTKGHTRIIRKTIEIAEKEECKPFVFIVDGLKSGSDKEKNPLTGYMRKELICSMFPNVTVDIINTAFDIFDITYVQGYEITHIVSGSDRVNNYIKMLNSYSPLGSVIGIDRGSGEYNGVSGTAARTAAFNNDFQTFKTLMPQELSEEYIYRVFEIIKGVRDEFRE